MKTYIFHIFIVLFLYFPAQAKEFWGIMASWELIPNTYESAYFEHHLSISPTLKYYDNVQIEVAIGSSTDLCDNKNGEEYGIGTTYFYYSSGQIFVDSMSWFYVDKRRGVFIAPCLTLFMHRYYLSFGGQLDLLFQKYNRTEFIKKYIYEASSQSFVPYDTRTRQFGDEWDIHSDEYLRIAFGARVGKFKLFFITKTLLLYPLGIGCSFIFK